MAFIQERLRDARKVCADTVVLIEQRLDFSLGVPGGFGTGDCVIIAEPTLQINDLKYGQGHGRGRAQSAVDALCPFSVECVRVALRHHRGGSDDLPAEALEHLNLDDSGGRLGDVGGTSCETPCCAGSLRGGRVRPPPGEWCRFCKLAPTCRTRDEANLALA